MSLSIKGEHPHIILWENVNQIALHNTTSCERATPSWKSINLSYNYTV